MKCNTKFYPYQIHFQEYDKMDGIHRNKGERIIDYA